MFRTEVVFCLCFLIRTGSHADVCSGTFACVRVRFDAVGTGVQACRWACVSFNYWCVQQGFPPLRATLECPWTSSLAHSHPSTHVVVLTNLRTTSTHVLNRLVRDRTRQALSHNQDGSLTSNHPFTSALCVLLIRLVGASATNSSCKDSVADRVMLARVAPRKAFARCHAWRYETRETKIVQKQVSIVIKT